MFTQHTHNNITHLHTAIHIVTYLFNFTVQYIINFNLTLIEYIYNSISIYILSLLYYCI